MNGRPDVDYYEGYDDFAHGRPPELGRSRHYYAGYSDARAGLIRPNTYTTDD